MSDQNYTAAQLDEIFGPGAAAHAAALLAAAAPAAEEAEAPLSAIGAVASDAAHLAEDVASKNVPGAVADAIATAKDGAPLVKAAKVFYHLYVCRFVDCLKAANPLSGSWHQRGVHLAQSFARTDVLCPGCGKPMVIGRNGLDAKGNALPAHITEDRDGNAVLHGQPIIQEAPGQEDQTAQVLQENARS